MKKPIKIVIGITILILLAGILHFTGKDIEKNERDPFKPDTTILPYTPGNEPF